MPGRRFGPTGRTASTDCGIPARPSGTRQAGSFSVRGAPRPAPRPKGDRAARVGSGVARPVGMVVLVGPPGSDGGRTLDPTKIHNIVYSLKGGTAQWLEKERH